MAKKLVILAALFVLPGTSAKEWDSWRMSLRGLGPFRVGMTLSDVRRILGDKEAHLEGPDDVNDCSYLESTKLPGHQYVDVGHYLIYEPARSKYGFVFETDGVKVTSFRVGTPEAIALVEGCS